VNLDKDTHFALQP